jgi:monovalent cation/proton antiporter MnhG/PhaG subunit
MIEVLSYVLKAGGVAFLLVAAVGVLRLPDAFTRMHAATKAGTLGAGLVVLGSALALQGAVTIATALATLFILLLTVPLASHLLGRAAYVSGAPFWGGTEGDALEGTLPRGPQDNADATGGVPEPLAIGRVVVAPTYESACAATTAAFAIARPLGLPVKTVGIIDPAFLTHSAADARAARQRLQATLMRAAAVGPTGDAVEVCEEAPLSALRRMVRPGDLVVLPGFGWYNHGVGREPDGMSGRGEALMPLARGLDVPVLLAGPPGGTVERVTVVDDGSEAIVRAVATITRRGLFDGARIVVAWGAAVEPSRERRALLCSAGAGRDVTFSTAKSGTGAVHDPGEVVVSTTTFSGRADWYGLDWHDRVAPGWRGHLLLV